MNYYRNFGILLLGMIVIFSHINTVDGHVFKDTREEYIEFVTNTGNRNHIFDDSSVDFCIQTNNLTYQQIAKEALREWQHALVESTENQKVWNINSHVLPKDKAICDGFINYEDIPEYGSFLHSGVIGFSDPLQQNANVTIYTKFYQEYLREITEEQWKEMTHDSFKAAIQNKIHDSWSDSDIKRVTLHELGHAFGLNHPCEVTQCDLYSQEGIMGYNMSDAKIRTSEAKQITKMYPNGFENRDILSFKKLDDDNSQRVYFEGEMINFLLEFPRTPNDLEYTGYAFYLYPENVNPLPSDRPSLTFSRLNGDLIKHGTEGNDFFKDFHSFPIIKRGSSSEYEIEKYVVTTSFVATKEISEMRITFILEDQTGQQKQFEFDTPFVVKRALFSEILSDLDRNQNQITFKISSDSPNKAIEDKYHEEKKREMQYYEALKECLSKNNSKFCTENIIREE